MNERIKTLAFALLVIGTAGLLANELILSWGRSATLIFAAANGIGLIALGIAYFAKVRVTPRRRGI